MNSKISERLIFIVISYTNCSSLTGFVSYNWKATVIKMKKIIIIISSRHQHGYLWLSLATPPYHPLLPAGLQGYIPYRHRAAVLAGRPLFARPCEGIPRSTSLMSTPLLLQQCLACLVRLTLIVFVIGGRWPYSCYFVGHCLHDLSNIANIILV